MSFDLSWIAIPTAQRTALMEAMRLEPTGETGNWGDAEDWSLLELESGWSVLISKDEFFLEDEEAIFARISTAGALNWGCVNETAMVSGSTWVESGTKHWSIEWNGSRGTDGATPRITGELPAFAAGILEDCRRDQDQADADTSRTYRVDRMIDAPAKIMKHLTGYRYDTALADGRDDECIYLRRHRARASSPRPSPAQEDEYGAIPTGHWAVYRTQNGKAAVVRSGFSYEGLYFGMIAQYWAGLHRWLVFFGALLLWSLTQRWLTLTLVLLLGIHVRTGFFLNKWYRRKLQRTGTFLGLVPGSDEAEAQTKADQLLLDPIR